MEMKIYKILLVIIVFTIIGGGYSYIKHEKLNEAKIKENTKIVIDDNIIDNVKGAIIEENEIFVPVSLLEEYLFHRVDIFDDGKRAHIDLKNSNYELETPEITEYVKNQNTKINTVVISKEGTNYVPIKTFSKLLGIRLEYNESSKVLIIDKSPSKIMGAINHERVNVKVKPSKGSFTLSTLAKDDIVNVYDKYSEWYRIRTEEGYIGYIHEKNIDTYEVSREIETKLNNLRRDMDNDSKINITWEYVYEKTPDISSEEKIDGLDVLSPTWFSLGEDGIIINKGDLSYVNEAHVKGYKVWGLVDNSFDPDLTSELINNDNLKKKFISQLLLYSSLYNLDGINIDFENIYYKDKDKFAQFVEELTFMLRKQNLVVSIDITVPGGSKNWSLVYDRERISKVVDYIALMAYDEHWATSPVSGSVASIGWVEKGITRSLENIPKEKLLLGIPFYTRVWKETKDADGNIVVSSKAVPIKNIEEILIENNAKVIWDEKSGQNFAIYEKEDSNYKIWIEDEESIKLKIKLAEKYDLKGIAAWRKGYEDIEVWEVIKTFKDKKNI